MTNDKQLGQEQRYVIDRLLRQGKARKRLPMYSDIISYAARGFRGVLKM
jgi:hypothetical protein